MTSLGVIYRITHRESGRCYIGQTTQSIDQRWRQHQRQSVCIRLHRAISKYGPESFDVERLGAADSKLQLDFLERFWIGVHQATDRASGFNLREGGSFGKHTDASKRLMSQKTKAAWNCPELRQAWIEARRRPCKPEVAAKIAASNTGKRATGQTKAVLSGVRATLWQDPTYRETVTAAQTAGKRKPEARAAAAEKSRAQWADPEKRKALLAAQAAGKARAKASKP